MFLFLLICKTLQLEIVKTLMMQTFEATTCNEIENLNKQLEESMEEGKQFKEKFEQFTKQSSDKIEKTAIESSRLSSEVCS